MLTVEHQLTALVVDRCPGRHLAGGAVRAQIDNLQLRVERVACVDLGEEFARDAGEGDEDVADVLREQGRSGRRECQHLQAMNDRSGVAMAAGIFDVVVDRMVCRRRLPGTPWRGRRSGSGWAPGRCPRP